jgi:hypothetical protein
MAMPTKDIANVMAYETPPKISGSQLDKIGAQLAVTSLDHMPPGALDTLLAWRVGHRYQLDAMHRSLRRRALRFDPKAITAQRLKRLESIVRKRGRQATMGLSQMQDIGGCRAIIGGMPRLNDLVAYFEGRPLRAAELKVHDYIGDPKPDGYRSLHLRYRFKGKGASLPWDRLRIEIQIRTIVQHAWATVVETVDTFTGQDLKFGGGSQEWRRFFSLMGSVGAMLEKSALVPGTPFPPDELREEIADLEAQLHVKDLLTSFARLNAHDSSGKLGEWYLLKIKPSEPKLTAQNFSADKFSDAKNLLLEAKQCWSRPLRWKNCERPTQITS